MTIVLWKCGRARRPEGGRGRRDRASRSAVRWNRRDGGRYLPIRTVIIFTSLEIHMTIIYSVIRKIVILIAGSSKIC